MSGAKKVESNFHLLFTIAVNWGTTMIIFRTQNWVTSERSSFIEMFAGVLEQTIPRLSNAVYLFLLWRALEAVIEPK